MPLYFRIVSVMGSRVVSISPVAFDDLAPVRGALGLALGRVVVSVDELTCSLFDDHANAEIMRLTLERPSLDLSLRNNPNPYTSVRVLTDASLQVASIQLDNHSLEAGGEFPVVLAPQSVVKREGASLAPKMWLSVRLSYGVCKQGLHVEDATVVMQPLVCWIGEAFVLYAQSQLQQIADALAVATPASVALSGDAAPGRAFDAVDGTVKAEALAPLIAPEAMANPYIRHLKISSLACRVTLHFNVPRVHLYLGMDNSPLSIREVVFHHVSMAPADFARNLLSLYVADLVASSPSLLGSLQVRSEGSRVRALTFDLVQILGNPTSFLSSIVDGLYDLLAMPIKGARDQQALGLVVGVGRGGASFLQHLSVGTLRSFSGWLSSVAKNMDTLTLDEAYLLRHIRERALTSRQGIGGSLVTGMRGLGSSVLEGVVGIVATPYAGAQQSGFGGFMTGSALGLWNAVAKPVGGVVSLVGTVAQGALMSVGGGPFSVQCTPGAKHRVRVEHSAVKWRRKFGAREFLQAFDCVDAQRGPCVVVFVRGAVVLVVDSVLVWRAQTPAPFTERDGAVFDVPGGGLFTVPRKQRRDFAKRLRGARE